MRNLFSTTLLALTLSALTAFAQTSESSGADLKQNMKQAGDLFKPLGTSLSDPSKNTENAKAAGQLAEIFQLNLHQIPDHIKEIPPARQAEALKGYQEMIQQCIDLSLALQQAFLNNDNAVAAKIYREMKDLKQDGHDQYDP